MMINELKNNSMPWQDTVPQQMPWMSSYEPTSFATLFGQQSLTGGNLNVSSSDPISPQLLVQPQQQDLSIASFPAATTTLTSPVTACPTTLVANILNRPTSVNMPPHGTVTTTTQSSPLILMSGVVPNYDHLPTQNVSMPMRGSADDVYSITNSLTQIPLQTDLSGDKALCNKRSSIEMEDEQIKGDEPPTKQLLSERRLFKQFGSLQLNGGMNDSFVNSTSGNSDDSDDEQSQPGDQREEFNRYVYILFKDKKGGSPFTLSNTALDRLARDERDKLSKAVVLWNPPMKNPFGFKNEDEDDSDDEEFKYSDHKDFLKASTSNSSVIITEITSEGPGNNTEAQVNNEPFYTDPDDIMLE